MCRINFYCSCRAACGRLALLNCVSANADTPDKTFSHTQLAICLLYLSSYTLSTFPLDPSSFIYTRSYLLFAAYLHTGHFTNTSNVCAQSPLYSTNTHTDSIAHAQYRQQHGLAISHTHTLYLLSLTRTLFAHVQYTQQHCLAIFQALCQSL